MGDWTSFYVIVGSSAAALIGMQFVVMTLVAGRPQRSTGALKAFATPTVVHLTAALVASAILSAPSRSPVLPSTALTFCAAAGLAYGAVVIGRMGRQTGYRPVWQDWVWYGALPCAAYGTLLVGAAMFFSRAALAPDVIAIAALALLLLGIHNAWDSVTHLVTQQGDAS